MSEMVVPWRSNEKFCEDRKPWNVVAVVVITGPPVVAPLVVPPVVVPPVVVPPVVVPVWLLSGLSSFFLQLSAKRKTIATAASRYFMLSLVLNFSGPTRVSASQGCNPQIDARVRICFPALQMNKKKQQGTNIVLNRSTL